MLTKIPKYGVMFTFVAVASLGLPGLAGFWGEFAAMWAAINPGLGLADDYQGLYLALVVIAAIGTVLTAGYFLWLMQRINLGKPLERWVDEPLDDIQAIEWVAWTPLFILILALGVYPRLLFGVQNDAVANLVAFLGG
jgi:NADH-quinone oxidoreductase subunit M